VLNIEKHAIHDIHILTWGPYARGAPGQLPSVPMRLDDTASSISFPPHLINFQTFDHDLNAGIKRRKIGSLLGDNE